MQQHQDGGQPDSYQRSLLLQSSQPVHQSSDWDAQLGSSQFQAKSEILDQSQHTSQAELSSRIEIFQWNDAPVYTFMIDCNIYIYIIQNKTLYLQ